MAVARNIEVEGSQHIELTFKCRCLSDVQKKSVKLFVFRRMKTKELWSRIEAEPDVMLHPHFDPCVREGLTAMG